MHPGPSFHAIFYPLKVKFAQQAIMQQCTVHISLASGLQFDTRGDILK